MKRLILGSVLYAFVLIGISATLPVETQPQPISASQTAEFDYTDCQYPDRWSNPLDGCDNSDLAVPECVKELSTKASEDACIAAFVAQHEKPTVVEQPNIAPVEVSECGGK